MDITANTRLRLFESFESLLIGNFNLGTIGNMMSVEHLPEMDRSTGIGSRRVYRVSHIHYGDYHLIFSIDREEWDQVFPLMIRFETISENEQKPRTIYNVRVHAGLKDGKSQISIFYGDNENSTFYTMAELGEGTSLEGISTKMILGFLEGI